MKKIVLAAFLFVSTISTNLLADIKMGIILGFTGPIESLTPEMAASAELAFRLWFITWRTKNISRKS